MKSLHINTSSKAKVKAQPVVDSWEDEAEDATPTDERDPSTETSELNSPAGLSRNPTNFDLNPPPPTPASPTEHAFSLPSLEQQQNSRSRSGRLMDGSDVSASERRPDKTTATASRLIAAGLGLKAPKRTEEEKEYDRTMRANARKAREKEKEEEKKRQEASERAKAAVWDD